MQQIGEQRAAVAKKQEEDEKAKAEREARAKELVTELNDLVEACDAGVIKVKESMAPLEDSMDDIKKTNEVAKAADAALDDAKAAVAACTQFILKNGKDIKDQPSLAAMQNPSETQKSLTKLMVRINECKQGLAVVEREIPDAKHRAVRKAASFMRVSGTSWPFSSAHQIWVLVEPSSAVMRSICSGSYSPSAVHSGSSVPASMAASMDSSQVTSSTIIDGSELDTQTPPSWSS